MSELVRNYVSFVLHPFQDTEVTGIQVYPQFYHIIAIYTAAFSALFQIVPYLLSSVWPVWYKRLEPAKRREMPSYLISYVHHFIAVPLGWLHIYQDYITLQSGVPMATDHYALKECSLVFLGCAYLLADTINFSFGEAVNGKPLYLLHHVLSIALGKSSENICLYF